ncbi:MAG: hypothetical protein QOJ54_2834 [Aliidongia sp.]|nr:hypothetical protein [Aliidongia sp.]
MPQPLGEFNLAGLVHSGEDRHLVYAVRGLPLMTASCSDRDSFVSRHGFQNALTDKPLQDLGTWARADIPRQMSRNFGTG